MLILTEVKEAIVKFPIEKYYKEFTDKKRDNPFVNVIVDKITFGHFVLKNAKLLDGVEIKSGEKPTIEQLDPMSFKPSITVTLKSPDLFYTSDTIIWGLNPEGKPDTLDTRVNILQNTLVNLYLGLCNGQRESLAKLSPANLVKVLGREVEVKESNTVSKAAADNLSMYNQFEALCLVFNQDGMFQETTRYEEDGVTIPKVTKFQYVAKLVRKNEDKNNAVELANIGIFIQKIVPNMKLKLQPNSGDKYDLYEAPKGTPLTSALHNDITSGWEPKVVNKDADTPTW